MKKFLLFFATLLCVSSAYAVTKTYEFYYNNKSAKTYTGDQSFWSKTETEKSSQNATYWLPKDTVSLNDADKIKTTKGMKFESSSYLTFTLDEPGTMTVYFLTSQNNNKTPGIDGVKFTAEETKTVPVGFENVTIYKKDLEAGTHTIKRGDGTIDNQEFCLLYIGVEMEIEEGEKLPTPSITDDGNCLVTIGEVNNSESIVYTIDGTAPTKDSQKYTAPFTVEDGTVVNARALGDGVNYSKSDVATKTIYLGSGTVATPTLEQYNGTFAISCSTINTSLKYSLDGGTEWIDYTIPVTLKETTTVKVKATRDGWTDGTAEIEVTALPAVKKTKTIYLGNGSFTHTDKSATDRPDGNEYCVYKGTAGDESKGYGFNLVLTGNAEKEYTSGNAIQVAELGATRTGIKVSNGAQNTLEIPEGIKVNRITFYSYVNVSASELPTKRLTGWKEVNGESIDYEKIPMACPTDNAAKTPDVRIFNFDGATGKITFNNGGEQLAFVMAVEIDESPDVPEATVEGVEDLSEGLDLKGQPAVVKLEAANDEHEVYAVFVQAEETEANTRAEGDGMTHEDLEGKTFNKVTEDGVEVAMPGTLYYFAYDPTTKYKSVLGSIVVTDSTSGIEAIDVDANAAVEYYNLQGVRVANPENGIFIRRQGNSVSKVIVK